MSAPQTRVIQALLKILQECKGRSLSPRALVTYATGRTGVPLTDNDVGMLLDDLVAKGYAARTANALNPSDVEYRVTMAGSEVLLPPGI